MEKYRILITGHNTALQDDFFNQLNIDYNIFTTSLRYEDIENHIKFIMPQILVIGLSDEQKEDLNVYIEAERLVRKIDMQVIIVGTSEECETFQKYTSSMAQLVITKPTTVAMIHEKIDKYMADLEQAKIEAAKALEEEEKKARENRRKHILVIDDDSMMLKLIKEQLHDGYDVATAINGKVALKFLETKSTDLILLDYEMPGMTGPEVLEKIRENEAVASIPVVFLTGVTEKEKIAQVLIHKPQGYLLKPIERERLLGKIAELIGPGKPVQE